jgi:hypothetical protein
MKVKLSETTGTIAYGAPRVISPGVLERDAVFCYEGVFIDMDGNKVKVTADKLGRLAENHNRGYQMALAEAVAAGKTEVDPAQCPPIQVDHSTSGWDTVGRVFGLLRLVDGYVPRAGSRPVTALVGPARFLGEDNCERASDGRWATLSTAADFEEGQFTELTVTPFPAAKSAKLLAEGKEKGDPKMDKEKLKRHLTECKKMSAEDADKHLAALSDDDQKKLAAEADDEDKKKFAAEKDEADKKLAAEKDEADKKLAAEKDEKEKEAKLAAERSAGVTRLATVKTGVVRLAKEMRTNFAASRLESKKQGIITRLSNLRAQAKITPAEIKKIDIVKLAAKSEPELTSFFEGYDSRETVILVGQQGSAKAEPVARLAKQHAQRSSKQERLSSMPFTARAVGKKYGVEVDDNGNVKPFVSRLAEGQQEQPSGAPTSAVDHGDRLASLNSRFAEACKMMDEGKREDAMRHLKDWMMTTHSGGAELPAEAGVRMSALAEHSKKLENQFEELVKLVSPLLEIGESDLT